MAEKVSSVDTSSLYDKLNSQIEELKGMLKGASSTAPVADYIPEKKKRARPNLSEDQIKVLKERLVKAREAKKAKRMSKS